MHLPSLIVFVDPYSRFDVVREFLREGRFSPDEFERLRTSIEPEAQKDLIQRITSLHHEIKHFHDLLLTPFGNAVIRSSFKYAISASVLLRDGAWKSGDSVDLPLRPGSTKTHEAVDRVLKRQDECIQLIQSARLTLEALASLAQRQLAWTQFGISAQDTLEIDLLTDPTYCALLEFLVPVLRRVVPDDELPTILHQVLLIGLGCSEGSPDAFPKVLVQAIDKSGGIFTVERLNDGIAKGWTVMIKNMKETDEINDKFLADVSHITLGSAGLDEALQNAITDYCSKSRLLRSQFLEDPDSYVSLFKYVDKVVKLVSPLIYFYSVNDELSLFEEPLDLSLNDLSAQTVFKKPGSDVMYYSHRLHPVNWKTNSVALDRSVWTEYAKLFGGVALVEEVDWLHPLNTFWLKSVENHEGIRFRRSFLTPHSKVCNSSSEKSSR
jgi:hypothetical protein